MRIELPSPSWADAHRAQDDAHTLTLPEQHPLSALTSQLLGEGSRAETLRTRVAPADSRELTLTL